MWSWERAEFRLQILLTATLIYYFFWAAFSTKSQGRGTCIQDAWLACSRHLEYKWQCLEWKPTPLQFPLNCVLAHGETMEKLQREEWKYGFPQEQWTLATKCKVIFDFCVCHWCSRTLKKCLDWPSQMATQPSPQVRENENSIRKSQFPTALLSGSVPGTKLRALVAFFYLTVKIHPWDIGYYPHLTNGEIKVQRLRVWE